MTGIAGGIDGGRDKRSRRGRTAPLKKTQPPPRRNPHAADQNPGGGGFKRRRDHARHVAHVAFRHISLCPAPGPTSRKAGSARSERRARDEGHRGFPRGECDEEGVVWGIHVDIRRETLRGREGGLGRVAVLVNECE